MPFGLHSVRLDLDKELYIALIDLQSKKHLGPPYAGLLAYNEGMHKLGFINDDVYERHRKKYSIPLTETAPGPLSREETLNKEKLGALDKLLQSVYKEWDKLTPRAQESHYKRARDHPNLFWAGKILAEKQISKQDPSLSLQGL